MRLRKRYDNTKTVILLQAQYNYQPLRLQDFKFVSNYNSALFDMISHLELYDIMPHKAELLDKTFFAYHVSNIILQQQC